jgi:hypothetical protein
MNNDLCRIMFEKEYSLFNEMTKKPDGTYADWNLQLIWNCWQKSWDTCKASDTSDTSVLRKRIEEMEEGLRQISIWNQKDQDDHDICVLQWRGCVAIARDLLMMKYKV